MDSASANSTYQRQKVTFKIELVQYMYSMFFLLLFLKTTEYAEHPCIICIVLGIVINLEMI